jgi:hypothetical protein
MEVVPCRTETIPRGRSEENGDLAGHDCRGYWFLCQVRNEVAPFLLCSFLVVAVIEKSRCERARYSPKDEPIAGWGLEFESG